MMTIAGTVTMANLFLTSTTNWYLEYAINTKLFSNFFSQTWREND